MTLENFCLLWLLILNIFSLIKCQRHFLAVKQLAMSCGCCYMIVYLVCCCALKQTGILATPGKQGSYVFILTDFKCDGCFHVSFLTLIIVSRVILRLGKVKFFK